MVTSHALQAETAVLGTGPDRSKPVPAIGPGRRTRGKVKFGAVTVTSPKPTKAEVTHNVEASTAALRRTKARLLRVGVRIHEKKDVPLFYVDPENPALFIRKMNGRTERGVLSGGEFKVVG